MSAEVDGGPDFTHVRAWVFDLDNTLYPSECDLFAQIDERMTTFVADRLTVDAAEARRLQKLYYVEHGTTLNGLMTLHDVDPHDFLEFVHDIDLAPVEPCADLRARLKALPGQRYVFTNGSVAHAERVLEARGLQGLFDAVFDIAAADWAPKPKRVSYERFVERYAVDPAAAAMFEDLPRNLEAPHALGFTTVLVRTAKDWSHEPEAARPAGAQADHAHVHHVADDLAAFLGSLRLAGTPRLP